MEGEQQTRLSGPVGTVNDDRQFYPQARSGAWGRRNDRHQSVPLGTGKTGNEHLATWVGLELDEFDDEDDFEGDEEEEEREEEEEYAEAATRGHHEGHWCAIMSDEEDGAMEEISEVIPREFLNCRLCNEEFQDPKLLPCLHSFCRRCLSSYIASQRPQQHHHQQQRVPLSRSTSLNNQDRAGDNTEDNRETRGGSETPDKDRAKGGGDNTSPVTFPCPECGTAARAVDAGVLPDNVLARRLSCPSLTATPRDAASCASCGLQGRGDVPAAVHCANCDENLCAVCASAHDLQEETASHKVEPLNKTGVENRGGDDVKENGGLGGGGASGEDGGGGGRGSEGGGGETRDLSRIDSADSLAAGLSTCCDCYDAYDIDSMFCVDCDQALCADCHAAHDPAHRCAELSAIAQNFTAKIQEPVEDLKRDSQTLNRMLANLDRAERYAAKLQRDVQTRIRRRTRMLCGLIREYESMLLQEVERRHQHNMDAVQQRRLATSQHAASISAVTELTDKLLQFGSEEEKVALRRKVGHRVRQLCEADLPSDPLELTNLRLCEPSVAIETICNLFGELRTDVVHPGVRRRGVLTASLSLDSASPRAGFDPALNATTIPNAADDFSELAELEEEEEEEEGADERGREESSVLSSSDRSDVLKAERRKAEQRGRDSWMRDEGQRHRRHSYSGNSVSSSSPTTVQSRRGKAGTGGGSGLRLDARTRSLDTDGGRGMGTSNTFLGNGGGGGGLSGEEKTDTSNSSFQSTGSAQDSIPTQLLETPLKELVMPDIIARDNIKGVGVNSHGDIIVATIATAGGASKSAIYVLEQHGIVRGQIPVAPNWNVHCVATNGRVALTVARGDNRFKVKVLSEEGTGAVLADVHLESFGLNFVTATSAGQLLVASNRYAKLSSLGGKAAKSGGNIAVYDTDGRLEDRFTNEDLSAKGAHLLEKPHWLVMDQDDNVFVADPATHSVVGFKLHGGKLLFCLGNSDMDGEDLYQGPDSVCVDRFGHVIVTDKREGRIDVVSYQGQLLKSLFPSDPIKFVCTTPDKLLLVVPTEGSLKFYDYL